MSIFPSFYFSGKTNGMFLQLVHQNTTAIGCAGSHFFLDGNYWTKTTCNYASSNVDGLPVYEGTSTAPAASRCTTGPDSKYTALCGDNEPVDPNYKPGSPSVSDGSSNSNSSTDFSKVDYCKISPQHVGCNATDVSFSKTNISNL